MLNFVGSKIPLRHWCRTFDYTNKGRLQLSDWRVSILYRAELSQAGAYKKGNYFDKRRGGNNDDDDHDHDDNKNDDNDSNNFSRTRMKALIML